MQYVILGQLNGGEKEEIDETDSTKEARYLVREYKIAFGSQWVVWFEQRTDDE